MYGEVSDMGRYLSTSELRRIQVNAETVSYDTSGLNGRMCREIVEDIRKVDDQFRTMQARIAELEAALEAEKVATKTEKLSKLPNSGKVKPREETI